MFDRLRFGKRLPLPSTAQIIHELRMLILQDRIKDLEKELALAEEPAPASRQHSGGEPCSSKSP